MCLYLSPLVATNPNPLIISGCSMADGWLVAEGCVGVVKAYSEAVSDTVQYVRCVVLVRQCVVYLLWVFETCTASNLGKSVMHVYFTFLPF